MVDGKGFVGHFSNNRALLQRTRVQNAAERGSPRNQAQPSFCRCPAGEAPLRGLRVVAEALHAFLAKGKVVGDRRHLRDERPAVLEQPVSNPLAFSASPHATLRFPKLPRRGCETTAGSTEGWSNHLAFRIAGEALAA